MRVCEKIHFASAPDIEATLMLADFKSAMPVNATVAG